MEINRLRSIIRESISNNLKEIEDVAENAAMEAKLNAYTEAIEKVNKKIEMAESLEEMQELVDPTKLNELKKHKKNLEKSKEKLEKVKAKKNKGKEVVTDEPTDEPAVEEGDKYNPEDNWNDGEVDDPWNAGIAKNQPMDEVDLSDEEKEELRKKAEQNPSQALPEAFLKMQKLAGVITEAQYHQKKNS
jgi:glutaredoxin